MNINEIAAMAGVSRATISRYLNGGYVSAEKKEVIRQVIDETGYKPLSSAQTLRNHKTNYIGVIIPKINSDSISRMVQGISTTLAANHYQLLLACTDNKEKEELKYLDLFKENHVDGIILLGTVITPEHYSALKELSVPIVILAQRIAGYTCVYPDDYHAAKDLTLSMVHHASKWGYICATQKDEAVGRNRLSGFLDALTSVGQHIDDACIIESAFSYDAGYKAARELLEAHPDIDSLICATDTMAAGAMSYVHELGKDIPNDIQIAGFGDSAFSQATFPPLTTIHFHYQTSGKEAAKSLLDLIQHPDSTITKELKLGYQLIKKGTTR